MTDTNTTSTEAFLQQQKERNKKKKHHTIALCVVVCVLWIPIALLLYKPTFLFEKESQSNAASIL